MQQNLQYIVDDFGNRTSVIVPYNDWGEINDK